jgi:hypothetical protein
VKHLVPDPLPGLFSFATPCLRWKIIQAIKAHNGFPGFIAPYRRRYLDMLVTYTVDDRALGSGFGITTTSQLYSIDRITGGLTPTSANVETAPYLPFPYTGLTPSVEGSVWQVSEDHYIHTVTDPNFGIVVTVDVQLSNQYTLAMLESDTDDLLATIDINQVNWFTLVSTQNGALDDPTRLLPPQYTYGPSQFPGPVSIPQLGAAAWSVLVPEPVGNTTWIPNVYAKAIGYFAMAGNYCEKTFLLDYNGAPLSNSCSSGVGTCAGEFLVKPPPLTDRENAYVLIVPNCVCG